MSFILFVYIIAALFSFFVVGTLIGALFSKRVREKLVHLLPLTLLERLHLRRSPHNPILLPGTSPWTAEAVLNPAAIKLGGRTHLIYRAIGMDGVSRLGYASSPDGIVFDKLLPYPVYVARRPHNVSLDRRRYSPVMYPSGGSWGGCEDPRMVVIADTVYVTFNMFDNWTLRVAVISMPVEDFLANRFDAWEGPFFLSHSGRDKNWVLFPELFDGKFAVLHSLYGEDESHVRIEYTDDLTTLKNRDFFSPDPQKQPNKDIAWHYRMRSAGPPPVRTDRGWLLFYHAMDPKEPNRYKLGAMLLDKDDPTKIRYRSAAPVLSPDAHYENHGKPGIVYAGGAVVRDGTLYVYYGGADKVVCVATAPLEEFVDTIIAGSKPVLATVSAQKA